MSVDYALIGKRVRTYRKESGQTQERLSESLGVSAGYISQIERGATKVSLDMLSNIAYYVKCDMSDLLSGTTRSQERYLSEELLHLYRNMNDVEKRLLQDIAECILKNQ